MSSDVIRMRVMPRYRDAQLHVAKMTWNFKIYDATNICDTVLKDYSLLKTRYIGANQNTERLIVIDISLYM